LVLPKLRSGIPGIKAGSSSGLFKRRPGSRLLNPFQGPSAEKIKKTGHHIRSFSVYSSTGISSSFQTGTFSCPVRHNNTIRRYSRMHPPHGNNTEWIRMSSFSSSFYFFPWRHLLFRAIIDYYHFGFVNRSILSIPGSVIRNLIKYHVSLIYGSSNGDSNSPMRLQVKGFVLYYFLKMLRSIAPKETFMSASQSIDILKEALLLEMRGRAFYRRTASQATNAAIAEVFDSMADEEERHVRILEQQMKSVNENGGWAPLEAGDVEGEALADLVLSDAVKSRIAAADFEAAAISAAMLMEENAINLYSARADAAGAPEEKRLFQWLADWEKGHLKFLSELDRDIKARIWNDNQFWPF
jgi:rubrerythrin